MTTTHSFDAGTINLTRGSCNTLALTVYHYAVGCETNYNIKLVLETPGNSRKSRYGGSLVWQITYRHGSTNG